jgi:hypothetical protein
MTMGIVLATDGSHDAQEACKWLGGSPPQLDETVRVITVVTVPPSPLDIPPVRDYQASLRHEARAVSAAWDPWRDSCLAVSPWPWRVTRTARCLSSRARPERPARCLAP